LVFLTGKKKKRGLDDRRPRNRKRKELIRKQVRTSVPRRKGEGPFVLTRVSDPKKIQETGKVKRKSQELEEKKGRMEASLLGVGESSTGSLSSIFPE